jgi:hypothetical protein
MICWQSLRKQRSYSHDDPRRWRGTPLGQEQQCSHDRSNNHFSQMWEVSIFTQNTQSQQHQGHCARPQAPRDFELHRCRDQRLRAICRDPVVTIRATDAGSATLRCVNVVIVNGRPAFRANVPPYFPHPQASHPLQVNRRNRPCVSTPAIRRVWARSSMGCRQGAPDPLPFRPAWCRCSRSQAAVLASASPSRGTVATSRPPQSTSRTSGCWRT